MIIIDYGNERYILKAKHKDQKIGVRLFREKYSADLVLRRKGELLFLELIPTLDYEEKSKKSLPPRLPVSSGNEE